MSLSTRLILSFFLIPAIVIPGRAQSDSPSASLSSFDVPDSAVLKTKEDYSKYEDVIIRAAQWLEETDLDKEVEKRQRINVFLMKWITGSPTVNCSIDEPILRIVDRNPELLSVYIASYSRSVLQNKDAPNTVLAIKAGILSVLKVYKKGIGVSRNRQLSKLAAMKDDGQIDDYIMDMLHMQKG